jgi:uncharacterized protein (TIRG00374 family)
LKARRRLLGGGLLAAVLLFVFFRGVRWEELGEAFRNAQPRYLAGVLLATLLTYTLRAWRWGHLLAPVTRVSFGRLLSATYVGFMTGLLVPRAGEVVRPYLIARRKGVALSAAFASIILERLFDLITVLVLFGLYLYVLPLPEAQRRGPLLGALKVGGALTGLAAVAVLLILLAFNVHAERVMTLLDRVLFRLPERLARPVSQALRSFGEGLVVLRAPPAHLLAIVGQSMLVWGAIALGIHWNSLAFGVELPFHSTFLIMGFLTVGVAVPTPGMVVGFHEAFLLALTEAFGVEKGAAAAAGISLHALNSLPVLILGLVLIGREGLTLGKVAEMTEEKTNDPDGEDAVPTPPVGDPAVEEVDTPAGSLGGSEAAFGGRGSPRTDR